MRAQRNAVKALAVGVGGFAALLAWASFAWACTPSAQMEVSPGQGPANSLVRVTGTAFSSGPVEIRWNSAGGPKLGDATGPDFSVAVRIPAASAGVYTILVVQPVFSGSRASFTVTAPAAGTSTTPADSRTSPVGDGSTSPSQGSSAPADDGATSPNQGGDGASRSGSAPDTSGLPTGVERPASSAPETAGSPSSGSSSAVTPANGATPAGVSSGTASTERRAAGSASAGAVPSGFAPSSGSSAVGAVSEESPASSPAPSARSAVADLWSGFATTGPLSARGPGLDTPVVSNGTPVQAVAAGLLSLGLVALFAGFSVAEMRRRRVLAS